MAWVKPVMESIMMRHVMDDMSLLFQYFCVHQLQLENGCKQGTKADKDQLSMDLSSR